MLKITKKILLAIRKADLTVIGDFGSLCLTLFPGIGMWVINRRLGLLSRF